MVTAKQCAEKYGIRFGRSGRAFCPFHDDGKHPALSFKEGGFHCFSCGAKGDSIAFVAKLFRLTPLQAAQTINADFRLDLDRGMPNEKARREWAKRRREEERERGKKRTMQDMIDWALLTIHMDEMGTRQAKSWEELERSGLMDLLAMRAEIEYMAESEEAKNEKAVEKIAAIRELILNSF